MRLVKLVSVLSLVFAASAGVTAACITVDYGGVAFRCNPRMSEDKCPEGYFCCSDDPTALSFDGDGNPRGWILPGYGDHAGKKNYADPLFSGENNNVGVSGMCIQDGEISPDAALGEANAKGCPIPCSPRWDDDEVEAVCGKSAACCPTVKLQDADCIKDDDLDCYRPVRGSDILDKNTDWKGHATHQDPDGDGCTDLFGGSGSKYRACIERLTVADARGFCVGDSETEGGGGACPEWADACEQMNEAEGLKCKD